jgi:hypothetical protein
MSRFRVLRAHSGAVRMRLAVIATLRRRQDGYSVAGTDVVQEKVAVRMNDLVPQSRRNCERAAIDLSTGCRGGD